ncbi:hypothetical protein F4821DRAFT_153961 [Hypoxylon rubiginosum]|uniref:Uncharacterized protein n=1 Tax=Hypoxylon rubiginosum TaxID=110542 RepID=A0ACC0CXR8_9PEZI|nr:hypothetical protein F4821DRAFT_153961 [Hypoxylon rubiginosum]
MNVSDNEKSSSATMSPDPTRTPSTAELLGIKRPIKRRADIQSGSDAGESDSGSTRSKKLRGADSPKKPNNDSGPPSSYRLVQSPVHRPKLPLTPPEFWALKEARARGEAPPPPPLPEWVTTALPSALWGNPVNHRKGPSVKRSGASPIFSAEGLRPMEVSAPPRAHTPPAPPPAPPLWGSAPAPPPAPTLWGPAPAPPAPPTLPKAPAPPGLGDSGTKDDFVDDCPRHPRVMMTNRKSSPDISDISDEGEEVEEEEPSDKVDEDYREEEEPSEEPSEEFEKDESEDEEKDEVKVKEKTPVEVLLRLAAIESRAAATEEAQTRDRRRDMKKLGEHMAYCQTTREMIGTLIDVVTVLREEELPAMRARVGEAEKRDRELSEDKKKFAQFLRVSNTIYDVTRQAVENEAANRGRLDKVETRLSGCKRDAGTLKAKVHYAGNKIGKIAADLRDVRADLGSLKGVNEGGEEGEEGEEGEKSEEDEEGGEDDEGWLDGGKDDFIVYD